MLWTRGSAIAALAVAGLLASCSSGSSDGSRTTTSRSRTTSTVALTYSARVVGEVEDGAVWLSTDDATDGVYRVDLASGSVSALGSIGHVDGEGEGIDASPLPQGDLHVLSIDVKIVPVRLIELRVAATPASR